MKTLRRGMVVDVVLDPVKGSETGKRRPCVVVTNNVYNARVPVVQVVPVTGWSHKKAQIVTNVELQPSQASGLTKVSIADCLQTRPVDRDARIKRIRGRVSTGDLATIDEALRIVFDLS